MAKAKHNGPLDGIRILDLTSVVMGPYCTQALADMGANVIKVESPEGDSARVLPPCGPRGDGGTFRALNRGKRSIVLDLRQPEGSKACLDLARSCDVLVHSMRLAPLQKLGLSYASVSAVNPGIVFCNLLGFGRNGRYAGLAAYDDIIQAVSGLVSLQEELTGVPRYLPTIVGDKVSGLTAVSAITAALLHKARTGEGQEVDVPMFETIAAFVLVEHICGHAFDPPLDERPVYARIMAASRKPFATADGRIAMMAYNDKQWANFARLIGRDELITDERFCNLKARASNIQAWNETIADAIATQTTAHWMKVLPEVGVPAIRINTTSELFTDPHLQDVGFFKSFDDPIDGGMRLPGFPVEFSKTPAGFTQAGPSLGEHTREVLEEAGFTSERIDKILIQQLQAGPK
jgi:crotonobetainyl-CoA:carnitine CoA-transferase CaiB-like acyl-CoA transferase